MRIPLNSTIRSIVLSNCLGVLLLAGCGHDGPELTAVSGTVRLDGKPLSNADLLFIPENGTTSSGSTDEDGHYKLQYSADRDGAMLGKCKVRISTGRPPSLDEFGKPVPGAKEILPLQYHRESTLTAEVKSGGNVIDFDLESKGKVVQPTE